MGEASEWDILIVDLHLADLGERLEAIKPTLTDARGIALVAFRLAFIESAKDATNPGTIKEVTSALLDYTGVSPEMQKELESWMRRVCEATEKSRQQGIRETPVGRLPK